MAEDPYKVLGVPRGASEDELRRAYRKLVKENHPDVNPGNSAAAEDKIRAINAAFAIVGDEDKRRQFDQGQIDANGEPRRGYQRAGTAGGQRPGQPGAEDFGFGDIFSDLFGRGRPGGAPGTQPLRGQDVRYTLEVDFLEAAVGSRKRVTLPEGGVLDLTVPEGVVDSQVLRLKAKGTPGLRGGEAGDAMVEIKVRAHPEFRREGDDILIELPITIDEAVLGARIEVPTISGRVQFALPKSTSSGRAFRIKGKGVNNSTTGIQGDQIVTIRIVLPERPDESLSYFLSEWRKKNSYKVRS
jgi:DnaJ-class molecular chaperone